ncbi:MAG: hypothetical protein IKC46_08895 [Lachnospiraceae bacterium]|nr:hypothetical protein [Lachnospiraceae bacterium]
MIPFKKSEKQLVSDAEMQQIYEQIKTPVKLGAVVKWENDFTDSPGVFKWKDKFYMYFIAISKDCNVSGYETHLAESEDLVNWKYIGPIFRRNDLNHWDSKQVAGYTAFYDIDFDGSCSLIPVNDSYYISYLAGNSDGYEPDPLYMGLSKSCDPTDPNGFTRFKDPILKPEDADGRPYENKTLYKSFMFVDEALTTGHKYVNAYNAKHQDHTERIFLAVSDDGENWERYGEHAVIDLVTDDPDGVITGDPQILKIGDIYVMLFFRYVKGRPAFNTFACSRDLEHWNVWTGTPLIDAEHDWENVHAHKTWFVRYEGKNYHFYCACNDKNERFIALATS